MHMVHTGSDGDTPDGRLGDFVHSAITTVRNAAGTMLGGLQQFGLLEEVGGGVGLGQSAGIRDGQLAGDSNTCARSVRFLLPKRSDGRPMDSAALLAEPLNITLSNSLSADGEQEPEHGAKRKYTRKEKTNCVEGKSAVSGKSECARLTNGRYRSANKSASKPSQSVLAPNFLQRSKTQLETNKENSPPKPEAAVENAPVKLVIKTPVYPNLSTSTHFSRIQPTNVTTYSSASTTYSSSIFPFPSAEQIASDVIQSIILHFNCKSALETMIRKNNLLKFKSHIKKSTIDAR